MNWPQFYEYPEPKDKLFQSDIFQLYFSPDQIEHLRMPVNFYILANTTCDLWREKLDNVVLIPIYPLKFIWNIFYNDFYQDELNKSGNSPDVAKIIERAKSNASSKIIQLIKGRMANFFFLSPGNLFDEAQCIELQIFLTIPLDDFNKELLQSSKIASLKSPKREQFGYWVGQFFSRIGIPQDLAIDEEDLREWIKKEQDKLPFK